jgi:hypothetical protein
MAYFVSVFTKEILKKGGGRLIQPRMTTVRAAA